MEFLEVAEDAKRKLPEADKRERELLKADKRECELEWEELEESLDVEPVFESVSKEVLLFETGMV